MHEKRGIHRVPNSHVPMLRDRACGACSSILESSSLKPLFTLTNDRDTTQHKPYRNSQNIAVAYIAEGLEPVSLESHCYAGLKTLQTYARWSCPSYGTNTSPFQRNGHHKCTCNNSDLCSQKTKCWHHALAPNGHQDVHSSISTNASSHKESQQWGSVPKTTSNRKAVFCWCLCAILLLQNYNWRSRCKCNRERSFWTLAPLTPIHILRTRNRQLSENALIATKTECFILWRTFSSGQA